VPRKTFYATTLYMCARKSILTHYSPFTRFRGISKLCVQSVPAFTRVIFDVTLGKKKGHFLVILILNLVRKCLYMYLISENIHNLCDNAGKNTQKISQMAIDIQRMKIIFFFNGGSKIKRTIFFYTQKYYMKNIHNIL
jgi:hypothetical protein